MYLKISVHIYIKYISCANPFQFWQWKQDVIETLCYTFFVDLNSYTLCITLIAVWFTNFSTSIPSYYLPLPLDPVSLSSRAFPCNQWYYVLPIGKYIIHHSFLFFRGKRLLNHKIKEVYNVAKDFCGALCFMEPNCISYNILVSNNSPSITKCEMNNATHFEHSSDLVSFPNSTYRGSKVCL